MNNPEVLRSLTGIKDNLDTLNTSFEKILSDMLTGKRKISTNFDDLKRDLEIKNKIEASQMLFDDLQQYPIQERLG